MKAHHICLISAGALLLLSCVGDPTKGGIFWSESKAQERQASMLAEMNVLRSTAKAEESKNSRLKATKAKLAQAQQRLNQLPDSSSAGDQAAERARLLSEIERLKREINALSPTM